MRSHTCYSRIGELELVSSIVRLLLSCHRSAARLKLAASDKDPLALLNLAVADAQSCIAREPCWAKGHRRLAEALRAAGRLDEAVKALSTGARAVREVTQKM